ncbi:hypothetical protein LTS18_010114, partial [Coniosporium uncinatum]
MAPSQLDSRTTGLLTIVVALLSFILYSSLNPAQSTAATPKIPKIPLTKMGEPATYSLPPLPYAYDALEPAISKQIMELHHSKHHQTYITNLNK